MISCKHTQTQYTISNEDELEPKEPNDMDACNEEKIQSNI